MKTWTVTNWSLRLAVIALPLTGGCARESVNPAPAIVTNQYPGASSEAAGSQGDSVPPPATAQDLENAPAKLVSTPAAVAPAASLSPSAAEVARLAQSGVDENVMLAFVNNSGNAFSVGSDQIIYLNDIGVPGNVVTAMIQRDQVLKTASPAPVYAYQPAPVQSAVPETAATQPAPVIAQDAPPPQVNVTDTYFYDTLSPYGNWLEVEGYGRCWQPSVEVADRSWTPYCDRGHWVYSDCGWYWASDYSWGWAPFHYGRWFRHNFWGWCWAPDTVWGPSWVSWRYNSGYCGWAPLPPTACYRPGAGFTYYGRSVGVSFGFGLAADCFTFVAADRFCDPQPFRHRIPHHQVTQIFNTTVIINPVVEDRRNPRYHRGIPPKHITDATHVEIKPVKIQETTSAPGHGRGENQDRNHGTLTVFRPPLPQPPAHTVGNRIGEGVQPATPDTAIRRFDPGAAMHRGIPRKTDSPAPAVPTSAQYHNETVPVFKTPVAGNNQPRNSRETEQAPAPQMKREIPTSAPVVRGPTPAATTPRTSPVQNSLLLKRQPAVTAPQQIATPVPMQSQPARPEQPFVREGAQRSQPRQEKVFVAPAVPTAPVRIQSTPPVRTYQAPVPPPSYAPRMEAPRVEARPAPAVQTPPASVQRPASNNSDGNAHEKRRAGGDPHANR